jgi:hypothetical protein
MVTVNEIRKLKPSFLKDKKNSLYICAAGFEDRVKGIAESIKMIDGIIFKYSSILEYHSSFDYKQTKGKQPFFQKNKINLNYLYKSLINSSSNILPNTLIDIDSQYKADSNFENTLNLINRLDIESVFVDISGMANFLILLTLNRVKSVFPDKQIFVLYTEAKEYFPKKEETKRILDLAEKRDENDILELGGLLGASGGRETMILPSFKGYFREDLPICLIFFAGYEPSRAIGLLEVYRPNIVIVCYGVSPHRNFKWRTKFSKELHNKLKVFEQYRCSYLEVSTFFSEKILSTLEEIYTRADSDGKILYENYNVAITPQCSKLQTVATYLFCTSHPDVQVVFCLPGSFNPARYSEGIGNSWIYQIT